MWAGPGFLGAALTMIAVDTHTLGVVGLIRVRTLNHFLFLDGVGAFIALDKLELPAPIIIGHILLNLLV